MLRKRKCSSCGEQKDEVEFGGYIKGSRPCRVCERTTQPHWLLLMVDDSALEIFLERTG